MPVSLQQLLHYTDNLLQINAFSDYCPNGLQVEASQTVSKIVSGVTASAALIEAAIAEKADLLLVHHGYFWKGEAPALTGRKGKRIQQLMRHNISLAAYHLPLDAHPQLGNNSQLGQLLGFEVTGGLDDSERPIGLIGKPAGQPTLAELGSLVAGQLQREPLLIGDVSRVISRVAWCTGAAQSYIDKAIERGVDCFITGEVSEPTFHAACEGGIAFIAAGHHATERYGVKALGEHLANQFAVDHTFVDIANPV
ncbi:MAG TPA: Nif3-like dinuclear metal center hexameric protein [Pseudomonadales bacterium]